MWTNGPVYAWEGEGNGNPLQYSILGNPMDKVAVCVCTPVHPGGGGDAGLTLGGICMGLLRAGFQFSRRSPFRMFNRTSSRFPLFPPAPPPLIDLSYNCPCCIPGRWHRSLSLCCCLGSWGLHVREADCQAWQSQCSTLFLNSWTGVAIDGAAEQELAGWLYPCF